MYISIADLMLVTFCLVDDWYQRKGARLLGRTVGSKPKFSDSEMLTLILAMDFFEFTSERRFVAFIRANYLVLFPKLLSQSQYNRRARSLRYLLNELRKDWAAELRVQFERHFLLDTTPIIAVGYRRDKNHSDFRGSAEYGYCAARRLRYFGYKLVMLTTLDGTPYGFELVPANTDERVAPTRCSTRCRQTVMSGQTKASWTKTGRPSGLNKVSGSGPPNARTSETRIQPSLTAC